EAGSPSSILWDRPDQGIQLGVLVPRIAPGGIRMSLIAQEGGPIKGLSFNSFANASLWVILAISLLALVFAAYLRREVLAAPEGTEKMKAIARAIQKGAAAYLNRQFRTLGIFLGV